MKQHKQKILIFSLAMAILGLVALVLLDYYHPLIKTLPGEDMQDVSSDEQVDLEQLEIDYKEKLRAEVIPGIRGLIEDVGSTTQESVSGMRQQVLDLKLPSEFRDMHVQLVLLLDMLEDDIREGSLLEKEEYQGVFDGILESYKWLYQDE